MSCVKFQKSSLAAYNDTDQITVGGELVNFGINRILTGTSIFHADGSNAIRLLGAGLYLVTFDADFIAGTTGIATVQLLNNSVAVVGAKNTVQATAAESVGLHVAALIHVKPSCCMVDNNALLQFSVSAVGVLNNVNVNVVKLA